MSIDTISVPIPAPAAGETETTTKRKERDKTAAQPAAPSSVGGMLWFAGWLFTIGFAQLVWWKALLAVIAWPYFLGIELRL
jgi:hypothetical protein